MMLRQALITIVLFIGLLVVASIAGIALGQVELLVTVVLTIGGGWALARRRASRRAVAGIESESA